VDIFILSVSDIIDGYNTKTILTILTIPDAMDMARQRQKSKSTHTIVLKIDTYNRLEKYKVKLISEKGTSSVTFDDVINELLDKVEIVGRV
jgi:hypothetical protein